MFDPKYNLVETAKTDPAKNDTAKNDTAKQNKPSRKGVQAAILAGGLTLTLVLGAFYAPVLWQSTTVAAAPARQLSPIPVTTASLLDDQVALADLYEAVNPSVVSIQTSLRAADVLSQQSIPSIPGLEIPGMPNQEQQLPEGMDPDQLVPAGQGTGWIYDNDGHIVTNNHVVADAAGVTVIFYDGTWADAEVVATDPQADLAVLKVTAPDGYPWRPLEIANNDDLRVGHSVIAIGNPYGYANTMTTGIISALGRSFPTDELGASRYSLPDVIQTDAAINPGNSGGPLLNLQGEVVGVNFAIESSTRQNSGVGFAIPVSIVEQVVPALIENGKFEYPYLGVSGASITPTVAKELGIENEQTGAYVASVVAGSPAADAGLIGSDADSNKGGDIIVGFNGKSINSFDALVAALVTSTRPGDTATLSILRDGSPMDVQITIGSRPGATQATTNPGAPESNRNDENGNGDNSPESNGSEGDRISAARAMQIAEGETEGMLTAAIEGRSVTSDDREGVRVWVVELTSGDQTATVVIDQSNGDVLEVSVE